MQELGVRPSVKANSVNQAPSRSAWIVVAFLCALSAFSYLDRYIIALLAQPIIDDLKIDATRIGLLIGLGFGLLYALAAPPLGHFLDTRNRVRFVGFGVMLWSASTVASGFAPNYSILMITRAGVAIGEALLVPAAVSLISDLFAPQRRALPIGMFMAVATLMNAGAFLVGGMALTLAMGLADVIPMTPWRLTLLLVGAPGVLLGLIWLFAIREPARTGVQATSGEANLAAALRHLRTHAGFFVPLLLAFGVSAISTYGFISWITTVLVRSYNQSLIEAGSLYGAVGMTGAALAAFFWPSIGGFHIRKGVEIRNVATMAAGLALGHSAIVCLLLVDSAPLALALIGVTAFGHASAGALAVLIIQGISPPLMRARIASLYILSGNVIGLTLGPALAPWIAEHVFSGPDALRTSLALVAGVAAPITVGLLLLSLTTFARARAAAV